MSPKISLIIPGIRPQFFQKVYDTFCQTWHQEFEIIFVTPCDLPQLKTVPRGTIQWFRDFGCPSRALQIGWRNAKADWVSFGTDDATYDSDTLNQCWHTLAKHNFDYKTVISCKYTESDSWSKWMLTPFYYYAWFHSGVRHWNIPPLTKLYMYGLVSKKLMKEIGGFDTKYESMALTYVDLSLRMKFHGCKVIIEKNRICHCIWQNKEQSDHSPVHKACVEHDIPLLKGIYFDRKFKSQVKIDVDNWKHSASHWPRRFPQ